MALFDGAAVPKVAVNEACTASTNFSGLGLFLFKNTLTFVKREILRCKDLLQQLFVESIHLGDTENDDVNYVHTHCITWA